MVSERGLEPPRAKSSLGPQPSGHGTLPLDSRTLEDRQDVPELLAAAPRISLTRSEVPARVPAETALSKTAGPGELLLPGKTTGQRSAHMGFLSLLRPRVNPLVDISR
jgi:hypothetical protein